MTLALLRFVGMVGMLVVVAAVAAMEEANGEESSQPRFDQLSLLGVLLCLLQPSPAHPITQGLLRQQTTARQIGMCVGGLLVICFPCGSFIDF